MSSSFDSLTSDDYTGSQPCAEKYR